MRPLLYQEIFTPIVCLVVVLVIMVISFFTYRNFKDKSTLSVAILLLISSLFLLIKSAYVFAIINDSSLQLALHLYRSFELVPVLYFPFLPYFLQTFIQFPLRLRKINNGMIILGATMATLIILFAMVIPDSFLSISRPAFPLTQEIYRGKGTSGPFLTVRDIGLGIYILWAFALLVISNVKKFRINSSIELEIGLAAAMILSIFDLIDSQTGQYLVFRTLYISRFDVGLTLFSYLAFWSLMKHFLKFVKENEEMAKILDKQKEQLLIQANYDEKTSLFNRRKFRMRLDKALDNQETIGIILLDLDSFHDFNEAFGISVGDLVLMGIADRIKTHLRSSDTAYRIGNDEFALLVPDIPGKSYLERYSEVLHALLTEAYEFEHRQYYMQINMGVLTLPEEAGSPEDALSHLFTALRNAKKRKNSVVFFSSDLRIEQERKVTLAHQIRESLEQKEFYILYQPILDGTGGLIALESLVRCRNNSFPGEFIPLAERSGMMPELGTHILNQVIHDLIRYPEIRCPVYINMSPEQFKDDEEDIAALLLARLKASGIPPHKVGFEISEKALVKCGKPIITSMQKLGEEGVKLSLDHFGSGSAVGFLEGLKLEQIKLDRDFSSYDPENIIREELLNLIFQIGRIFNTKLVAEFIEDETDFHWLKEKGIQYFQGYFFHKPMTLKELFKEGIL